jgi:hypothetical protein
MTFKKLALTVAIAATALTATGAHANQGPTNAEYYPLVEIMSMKMMDKNKDGMVSKQEFISMMEMAWDMNAKKMGAKDRMTPDQFQQVLMYLKAGG